MRRRGYLTVSQFRVFVVFYLAAAVASPAIAGPNATTVVKYTPWASGAVKHDLTVSDRARGTCWGHSLVTDRDDAWRCAEGNNGDVDDPCFSMGASRFVVACARSPFERSVTLLSLKKQLTENDDPTTHWLEPKGIPWGIRLTNGDECLFVWGATDAIEGERLNYVCLKAGWIIGGPDRSTAMWTARSVKWPSKRITLVRIATAVF